MNHTKNLPLTGYLLERVFSQDQSFQGVPRSESLPDTVTPNVNFGWDWQLAGEDRFAVMITLSVQATRQRPENVNVTMVGIFRPVGQGQTVTFQRFVVDHAPSILMPYAREAISSLTGRGMNGSLNLPPINVFALMEEMNPARSTGHEQLLADPATARLLGVEVELLTPPNRLAAVSTESAQPGT
jgi:preprotein translocase subunit SecB